MVATSQGAQKRVRRPDGTFAKQSETRVERHAQRFVRKDTSPDQVASLPPGLGRAPVQPATMFQSLLSSYSHTYRPSDEAIRHSKANARYMRNDCSIMECLEARKRATALLDWHIEPEDAKDENQKQLCEAITRVVQKTPRFKAYRESLLEALWFGRYANTHRWDWCWINGKKRAYVGHWSPVNGDKLKFRFDLGDGKYDPNEIGIRVNTTATTSDKQKQIENTDEGRAYFLAPWERPCLAVHRHIIEDGAFEDPLSAGSVHGVGIRSRIYWTHFQAQETLAMLMEYMERYGMGFAIGRYPSGDDAARAHMETTLRQMHAQNFVLMPSVNGDPSLDAYGIEIVQPTPAGAETLKSIITDLFGNRIKRYILGQTLTTESDGAGLGSSGISDLHKWSFYQIIKSDAIDLEETLTNEFLKHIIRFNFPEASGLDLRFKIDTDAPDVQAQLEALNIAYQMGLEIPAGHVYGMIGCPEPTKTDKILSLAMQQPVGTDGLAAAGASGNIAGQSFGAKPHDALADAFASHRAEENSPDNPTENHAFTT